MWVWIARNAGNSIHFLLFTQSLKEVSLVNLRLLKLLIIEHWEVSKNTANTFGRHKKRQMIIMNDYLRSSSTNDIVAKRKIHYQPLMIYLIRWRNVFWYRRSTGRSTTFLQCILSSTNISVIIGKYTGVIQLSLKVQKSDGS